MAKKRLLLTWIISLLAIIGTLNWGLIALNPSWNLVEIIFGMYPMLVRLVYGLVGLSGLGLIWILYKMHK